LAPTTYKETKRILESDGLPAWHDRPISSIKRRDVIGIIDAITGRDAKVQANRTLAGMRPPTKEWARDRALSDDELRWFWAASTEVGRPFGPLAQLLVLTAQRRDEVAGAGSISTRRFGRFLAPRPKTTVNMRCSSRQPQLRC
jgi:hypothetical protein